MIILILIQNENLCTLNSNNLITISYRFIRIWNKQATKTKTWSKENYPMGNVSFLKMYVCMHKRGKILNKTLNNSQQTNHPMTTSCVSRMQHIFILYIYTRGPWVISVNWETIPIKMLWLYQNVDQEISYLRTDFFLICKNLNPRSVPSLVISGSMIQEKNFNFYQCLLLSFIRKGCDL